MAHNLMVDDTIDENGNVSKFVHFVYAQSSVPMPWHGLGMATPLPFTPRAGLASLGGPKTVRVVPLTFVTKTGATRVSEKARLVVNQDDDEFAGVGADYEAFQEDQVADVVETALGDEPNRVITMGRLGRGERIFLSADMGNVEILDPTGTGFKEIMNHFLVVETSHDKSRAFVIRLTTIVPVCQNTITLGEKRQAIECRLLHTKDLHDQANTIAKALARTGVLVDKFEEAIKLLFTFTDVNEDDVRTYSKLLFPHAPSDTDKKQRVPSIVQNKRDLVHAAYLGAPGCKDTPNSGFRLYQAATRANGILRKGGWAQDQFQPASVDFRDRAYQSVLRMMEVVA